MGEKYQLATLSAVEKYTMLCQNAIDLDNINPGTEANPAPRNLYLW